MLHIQPGTVLANYRIVRLIARHWGGGAVYEAERVDHQRRVALKILPATTERFAREMRFAERLNHPHIVPALAVSVVDGLALIEMRLVVGQDIGVVLEQHPAGLQAPDAVAIIEQLAEAIDYAHGEGVTHRDVKPANAMLDQHRHVFLMDFGLARALDDSAITRPGEARGTDQYMAPEQWLGNAEPGSDIYSLAAVLYALLTGRAPYRGTHEALRTAHLEGAIPRPSEPKPRLAPFDAVIARGMAKVPGERHPTARALASAAREALDTISSTGRGAATRDAEEEGVALAISTDKAGNMLLARVTPDRRVEVRWHYADNPGHWTDWGHEAPPRLDQPARDIAAASLKGGHVELFALDTRNTVWHCWHWQGAGWHDRWEHRGRPFGTRELAISIAAASAHDGHLDVQVQAADGTHENIWFQAGEGVGSGWNHRDDRAKEWWPMPA